MTDLKVRIELLARLGSYIESNDEEWQIAKENAVYANSWFTTEAVELATSNIAAEFLDREKLLSWASPYKMPSAPRKVGIVMAGNIPLVGFHDFLCGFVTGHELKLKLSSKDNVLLPHLITKLCEWEPGVKEQVVVSEMLKGCDAYIATGSNNTARYFEQYFEKYPHLIRKNRTSVAVLNGNEADKELKLLAKDIFSYFGLGCRNVTQVCTPEDYNMERLLNSFEDHMDLVNFHKYKNNYDYHLAVYLLNAVPYQTNGSVLLVENEIPFSAVSVLHWRKYNDKNALLKELNGSDDIQAVVGHDGIPFGQSQSPALTDYADGVDTMKFLCSL